MMESESTGIADYSGFPGWNQEPGIALLSQEVGCALRGSALFVPRFRPSPNEFIKPAGDVPSLLNSQTDINIEQDYEIAKDSDSVPCARPVQDNLRTLFQALRARRIDQSMAMSLIGPSKITTPRSFVYDK